VKIVILTYAEVDGRYAEALIERGHEVGFFGGEVNEQSVKAFADYDGCLLLGSSPDHVEFADAFEAIGKKVWHQLADIPKG